jgi:hypothetical protein
MVEWDGMRLYAPRIPNRFLWQTDPSVSTSGKSYGPSTYICFSFARLSWGRLAVQCNSVCLVVLMSLTDGASLVILKLSLDEFYKTSRLIHKFYRQTANTWILHRKELYRYMGMASWDNTRKHRYVGMASWDISGKHRYVGMASWDIRRKRRYMGMASWDIRRKQIHGHDIMRY